MYLQHKVFEMHCNRSVESIFADLNYNLIYYIIFVRHETLIINIGHDKFLLLETFTGH